jgi:hypothetical protein
MEHIDAVVEATTAGVGSAVSKLATYPLDLLKTSLAVAPKDETLTATVQKLTEKRGVLGLYKGIQPKLVKSVTGKVLYFFIYRTLLDKHRAHTGSDNVGALANLVYGYLGEMLELPVVMPLEAIVARVQVSESGSVVQAVKGMYSEGGIGRFYVSLDAYLIGALQPAIQLTLFDQIRAILLKSRVKRGISGDMTTLQLFLLGVFASSVAATLLYPVDVVRTIVQTQCKKTKSSSVDEQKSDNNEEAKKNTGFVQVAQDVVRREGIAGLFKGLLPHLLQQVMSATVLLMVRERLAEGVRELLFKVAMAYLQRQMAAKAAARKAAKAAATAKLA